MKILLTSIGTRGDMEPFLAIGEMLQAKGNHVMCAFEDQFKPLVEDANMEFYSLGSEFMHMLDSDVGKTALGGSGLGFSKLMAFVKLAKKQRTINRSLVKRQSDIINRVKPDHIVHNGKALYPVLWEVTHPKKTTFISPVPYLHYVKGHAHLAFNSNFGSFINALTFKLADWGLVKAIVSTKKTLEIKGITKKQIELALENHTIIYTISPTLFPHPTYWKKNAHVLGYHERNKMRNWQPNPALLQFIKKHSNILFITFGSMTNPEPENKTKIIIDILEKHQIAAIINTAEGGLIEPKHYNKALLHFVKQIPYDWVLQKVYGIIHHGGSGTTHLALKNGCATLIIPHIIDQLVWNKIIHQKGIGPLGIKIGKISASNLEPLILGLLQDKSFKQQAINTQQQMLQENFEEELCRVILNN